MELRQPKNLHFRFTGGHIEMVIQMAKRLICRAIQGQTHPEQVGASGLVYRF